MEMRFSKEDSSWYDTRGKHTDRVGLTALSAHKGKFIGNRQVCWEPGCLIRTFVTRVKHLERLAQAAQLILRQGADVLASILMSAKASKGRERPKEGRTCEAFTGVVAMVAQRRRSCLLTYTFYT